MKRQISIAHRPTTAWKSRRSRKKLAFVLKEKGVAATLFYQAVLNWAKVQLVEMMQRRSFVVSL